MSDNHAPQPEGLLSVLLDRTATTSERDDAAMDLSAYDSDHVLDALLSIATDLNEDWVVAGSAGESIGEIWLRRGTFDRAVIERLTPLARAELLGVIAAGRPEWLADSRVAS